MEAPTLPRDLQTGHPFEGPGSLELRSGVRPLFVEENGLPYGAMPST